MAELKDGQKLRRQIKVYGVEQPVIATFTKDGLSLKVKGTMVEIEASWLQIVSACHTPSSCPSWLFNRPLALLQHSATQKTKRKVKKAGGSV